MDGDLKKAFWEELTWPEMRDAVKEERVVLLPTGSIEQHGPPPAHRHRRPRALRGVQEGGGEDTRGRACHADNPIRV